MTRGRAGLVGVLAALAVVHGCGRVGRPIRAARPSAAPAAAAPETSGPAAAEPTADLPEEEEKQ